MALYEKEGQRIRTADEILSGGLGNCLDMTMLYVSCLECIGLHPLIIMTDDQAYAGCWLIQDSVADSVNDGVILQAWNWSYKEVEKNLQAIKDATDEVQKAFYAVSEKLYQQAAPQGGCDPNCGGNCNDGPVDADYETVD